MQELRNKFQAGQAFLALSDYQIACVLLKVIADRSANTNPISTKFLSVGELENIYDSVSLPAAAQQQIDYKLMEAYQWLLSEGYIMPAPEQPAGVVTVTSKGRLGLPPESNVENRPLIEWAGGARGTLAIVKRRNTAGQDRGQPTTRWSSGTFAGSGGELSAAAFQRKFPALAG